MLTRLQVRGFKNLIEVDVRLGPFTCVAGQNGVGIASSCSSGSGEDAGGMAAD